MKFIFFLLQVIFFTLTCVIVQLVLSFKYSPSEFFIKLIQEKSQILLKNLPKIHISLNDPLAFKLSDLTLDYKKLPISFHLNSLEIYRNEYTLLVKVNMENFNLSIPKSSPAPSQKEKIEDILPSKYWNKFIPPQLCFKQFCLLNVDLQLKNIHIDQYKVAQINSKIDFNTKWVHLKIDQAQIPDQIKQKISLEAFCNADQDNLVLDLKIPFHQAHPSTILIKYDFTGNLNIDYDIFNLHHPKIPTAAIPYLQNKRLKGNLKAKIFTYIFDLKGTLHPKHVYNISLKTNKDFSQIQSKITLKYHDQKHHFMVDSKNNLNVKLKKGSFYNQATYFPDVKNNRQKIHLINQQLTFSPNKIKTQGKIRFEDFSYLLNPLGLSLKKINGPLKFDIDLIKIDKTNKWKIYSQKDINPFEKVDYLRTRPFYQDNDQTIIIKQFIPVHNKNILGPIRFDLEVEKNIAYLKNFSVDIDLGKMGGNIIFQYKPNDMQIGFYGTFSNIDPSKLLSEKYKDLAKHAWPNGRIHLVYSVNKNSLTGRIDIHEIQNDSLLQLLGMFDPNLENEKFNKIRSIIGLAKPKYLGLNFTNGVLDIELLVESLGSTNTFYVRGIPIHHYLYTFGQKLDTKFHENLQ